MSFDATSPLVVIIGAGFGGLSAAKQLVGTPFNVTIVDRHNYHLFQPLLYQVLSASMQAVKGSQLDNSTRWESPRYA
jgi:NADH dehydrogenase FAD-containing subunit